MGFFTYLNNDKYSLIVFNIQTIFDKIRCIKLGSIDGGGKYINIYIKYVL